MARKTIIDKFLEEQKKKEQQNKQKMESQKKTLHSFDKKEDNAGVAKAISKALKQTADDIEKQAKKKEVKVEPVSINNNMSFLGGTPKRQEIEPVEVQNKAPERSLLTGNTNTNVELKSRDKDKLGAVGKYRKEEQERYKQNKEVALQDEALQNLMSMEQTAERDNAKQQYMQDSNIIWRLNELRNKSDKTNDEKNELDQLEYKLLKLNDLRKADDTLVDDAIRDAAGVLSTTYNSAAYNADLLLNTLFNNNEKLTETRNADLVNQIQEGRIDTTQALNDSYGDWAGFLYQTGLSISDNLALRVLDAFVPGTALVAMGSNAAASKALEIGNTKEDATAFEQLGRGLVSGGIEYATEKMSFGALDDLLGSSNSRSVLVGMARQAFEEGREEGIAYTLNLAADALFGDEVKWSWGEFAQSVLGGAISGGVMGAPA